MLGLITLFAVGLSATLYSSVAAASIEDVIDTEMPLAGVPGVAYAVVSDGKIRTVGARGVLELGGDKPITPDTAFLIGSISKSFTALAVMQLVEAGKIDLDTELWHYLDVFSSRPAGAMEIRQLLSHTSGFSTLQGNASQWDATSDKDELARRVNGVAQVTPAYQPDDRWEYSNLNYQILGRLIEVVSGQSYQIYVRANILEPVGMDHSYVADGESHDTMATGHNSWFGTKRALADNRTSIGTAPQGGVVASARDLARYMLLMMNGQDDIISAEGKAEMMRPASDASPFYGFGWFVDSENKSVWHTGSSPGFETLATMIPTEKKGVVVLVNGGSGVGFGETTQLRRGIAAAALGLDYKGEGSRWSQKVLFVAMTLLPVVYLISMFWAWRHRDEIRAKSGIPGLFSLWFPLFTTLGAVWVLFDLVPRLFGAPLSTIHLFQPDFGLALIASAATGVLWAVFRLGVAYSGRFISPG